MTLADAAIAYASALRQLTARADAPNMHEYYYMLRHAEEQLHRAAAEYASAQRPTAHPPPNYPAE